MAGLLGAYKPWSELLPCTVRAQYIAHTEVHTASVHTRIYTKNVGDCLQWVCVHNANARAYQKRSSEHWHQRYKHRENMFEAAGRQPHTAHSTNHKTHY